MAKQAEDLVKALRQEAALLFSPDFSLIQTKNLMIEAADEIERLERCCNERDEFLGERGLFGEFIDWLRKSEPRRLIGG